MSQRFTAQVLQALRDRDLTLAVISVEKVAAIDLELVGC